MLTQSTMLWAEPFIAYAFAKSGKAALITGRSESSVDLCIRDPETGTPWFGPLALAEMMEELVRVLNLLIENMPQGNFSAQLKGDCLRLQWNPPARRKES